eukprot:gene18086-22142_t
MFRIARNPEYPKSHSAMTKASEAKAAKSAASDLSVEDVYRSVMDAIVDQRLLPGLTTRDGTCFARLTFESMVRLVPNRGAFVA